MRYRFIEREEMFKLMQKNSEHLTYQQMNEILDASEWVDLTFIFTQTGSEFNVEVINNNNEEYLTVDKLNIPAFNFYEHKLKELQTEYEEKERDQIRNYMKEIRLILEPKKINNKEMQFA